MVATLMRDGKGGFRRVSRSEPCPKCGGHDNCCVGDRVVWCGRVESDRQNAGGQHLHRLDADRPQTPRRPAPRPVRPAAEMVDPARLLAQWRAWSNHRYDDRIDELARLLTVSPEALFAIGTVYVASRDCWAMPERDANRDIIGFNFRARSSEKRRGKGHRAGLTFADGWSDWPGPIFIVEGASDTAAGLDLGLCVVGRPSNAAGAAMLADLLRPLPHDREVIVLGERDEKPDGRWPGRDGAVSVAKQLRAALPGRPVRWGLPPDGIKDVREWAAQKTKGAA